MHLVGVRGVGQMVNGLVARKTHEMSHLSVHMTRRSFYQNASQGDHLRQVLSKRFSTLPTALPELEKQQANKMKRAAFFGMLGWAFGGVGGIVVVIEDIAKETISQLPDATKRVMGIAKGEVVGALVPISLFPASEAIISVAKGVVVVKVAAQEEMKRLKLKAIEQIKKEALKGATLGTFIGCASGACGLGVPVTVLAILGATGIVICL